LDKTDHSNMGEGYMPPKLNRGETAQKTTVTVNCENGAFKPMDQVGASRGM